MSHGNQIITISLTSFLAYFAFTCPYLVAIFDLLCPLVWVNLCRPPVWDGVTRINWWWRHRMEIEWLYHSKNTQPAQTDLWCHQGDFVNYFLTRKWPSLVQFVSRHGDLHCKPIEIHSNLTKKMFSSCEKKYATSVDRTRGLQIFSLTLSQLSYRGL